MKALVIYLISNLMKLTSKNPKRTFCGLAWQFNYQKSNTPSHLMDGTLPYLKGKYATTVAVCRLCGRQKNVPTKLSGRKFYFFLAPLLSIRTNC